MTIQSLGYIGINSTDLSQWKTYGTEVLGLQDVTDQHPDSDKCLLLKMDDRAYRMVIQQSDTDSFGFCGWEAT
ncbi:MAG: biphenyl 2,3-dioxygenase, partial [Porticoccaceae bacterium]|nr:biphenyl 2,3-dioxygenase [Porticoccaceae bacterium]